MILPAPYPDETLCSLLARMGRLNGILDHREIAEIYFGEPVCPSFINADIHLPTFCERTGMAYGVPLEVIERFTWLGAQVRLGEVDASVLHVLANGDARIALGDVTFQDAAVVAFCPTCIRSDIGLFGVSYWHRQHQLLFVHCCPEHGDVLKRIKLKRAALHSSFPLPGDLVVTEDLCGDMAITTPPAWRDLACLVFQALHSELPIEASMASLALKRELHSRGLLDSKGRLNQKELVTRLTNELSEGDVGQSLIPQIRQSLRGVTGCNPMTRAVLVHLVFGSWRLFEERCRWEAALGCYAIEDLDGCAPTIKSHEVLRQQYRMTCIGYLAANPSNNRHRFIRNEYKCFRWLLHNDNAWLDSQLPINSFRPTQLQLF